MIIKPTDLVKLRKDNPKKKIVFCSGSFDLTHAGHILFFEDCKKYGDILVVGLGGDKIIKDLKGSTRPILNESIRMKTLDSLKTVDYVFLDEITKRNDFHSMFRFVFKNLEPDFYVLNEDVSDLKDSKELADLFNVKIIVLKRHSPKEFDNISTTRII